jgi:hypothetical protein
VFGRSRKSLVVHERLEAHERPAGGSNRGFGLVFAVFFIAIGGIKSWNAGTMAWWWLASGACFLALALLVPRVLQPLNDLWTKLGLLLYAIVSPLMLALLFYAVVTPIGLLMRMAGKDPLRLRRHADVDSYWIAHEPPGPPPATMKNQF